MATGGHWRQHGAGLCPQSCASVIPASVPAAGVIKFTRLPACVYVHAGFALRLTPLRCDPWVKAGRALGRLPVTPAWTTWAVGRPGTEARLFTACGEGHSRAEPTVP